MGRVYRIVALITIDNRTFRRALLFANAWTAIPAGRGPAWVLETVRRLAFVQVDPIAVVAPAHHQILFSRNPSYRRDDLHRLLEQDRALFESWTHDHAILPSELYPYWRHYLRRASTFESCPGYRRYFAPVTERDRSAMLRIVRRTGPLRPRDVPAEKVDWGDAYFAGPSRSKMTLEYLWRTGKLAITRRESAQKVYDLAERVIPAEHRGPRVTPRAYVDWACREALTRLVAASPARIAHFFDAITTAEAAAWCASRAKRGELVRARVEQADGKRSAALFALPSVLDRLADLPSPDRKLRLLSPFDPLIRDRDRARRVFGFDYTVEIWVPAKKRRYGYYVLPILEGDRFTGRLDAKADRSHRKLDLLGLWWEPGIKPGRTRKAQLDRALARLERFALS